MLSEVRGVVCDVSRYSPEQEVLNTFITSPTINWGRVTHCPAELSEEMRREIIH